MTLIRQLAVTSRHVDFVFFFIISSKFVLLIFCIFNKSSFSKNLLTFFGISTFKLYVNNVMGRVEFK